MLELGAVDLEELAMALQDQETYDHCWLLDPRTGQIAFWTSDTGIDGENPVEIDELDQGLISEEAARQFMSEHPEPAFP